jgi:pimeloyl-ACP methyl ester carboxylesterase
VALTLVIAAFGYVLLRFDQRIAAVLIWPSAGAQFVEIGPVSIEGDRRDTMVIVAGGLNRRNGNVVAAALTPSLGGNQVRIFSLSYGNGIYEADIIQKFDTLFTRYQPRRLILFGSSMGGDVMLTIAAHFQQTFGLPERYVVPQLTPQLVAVYLDCTPLSTSDVRAAARARADLLTGLTEKLGTDGGAGVRLTTELLATRRQWSSGYPPFLDISPDDLTYKWDEVWREKLGPGGVSTALVKDQYGVIRRFDANRVLGALLPGTRLVYLRPADAAADETVDVAQVMTRLRTLSVDDELDLTVLTIPGGGHASAARDSDRYNPLIRADLANHVTGWLLGLR